MSTTEAATPAGSFFKKWVWVIAAVVGMLSLTILKIGQGSRLAQLQVLYVLPEFQLTDQTGQPFGSKDLAGKVWIASFAFTSCHAECPMIGRANQRLQEKLEGTPVQLVTITVDPEFDTPALLTAWGKTFGADPARWHLLTGSRKDIEAVVIGDEAHGGFRTHMGERTETKGLVEIAHTMKFVLVDQFRGIRFYFDANDEKAMSLLVDHAKALARDGANR